MKTKIWKETQKQQKTRLAEALARLADVYGDAKPALTYRNSFELLIAVMLSAQCTDVRVNIVTEQLFSTLRTPQDFARLTPEQLEPLIRTCGLSKTKAKNIVSTCNILVERYHAEVPDDIGVLQTLPGVGRKTANVVASVAYGVPAIAVDTHVFRVSNRIGLADSPNVLGTEKQLMKKIPKQQWSRAHHWLIWHGRRVCTARNPKCETCFLNDVCRQRLIEAQI